MIKINDIKNSSKLKSYSYWISMHNRCDKGYNGISPQYSGVTVCNEWYIFSNFNAWFTDNFIESYQLDKDLLVYGNKIYSPSTCIFIPSELNRAITNLKYDKLNSVGVYKSSPKYSKLVRYAGCNTKEDANKKHLTNKIDNIKNIMNRYELSENVINACNNIIKIINDVIYGLETNREANIQDIV